jgi:hypothetical protein
MQATTLNDAQELADFLEQSEVLDITDHGVTRMYTVNFDSQDLLVFADSTGKATVVYPPESFDAEAGGSIHDHARAIAEHAA